MAFLETTGIFIAKNKEYFESEEGEKRLKEALKEDFSLEKFDDLVKEVVLILSK